MIIVSLFIANLKMIIRNRQALFWALAFPLIFVVVFGLYFQDENPEIEIAVVDHAEDQLSKDLVEGLRSITAFDIDERDDEAQARRALNDGEISYLLIIPDGLAVDVAIDPPVAMIMLYDEGNPMAAVVTGIVERFVGQVNLTISGSPTHLTLDSQGTISRDLSYFDFLLPGFVGMGVMTYSIIGLASTIASYREKNILKRILATPLRIRTFFAAEILAYLVLSLVQAFVIMSAGVLLFGGDVVGNYFHIGLVVMLGNLVFLSLGFIVGAFSKSVQAASGLGNAAVIPMMFFSGVFFPKENLPPIVAAVVEYLPLSPMLDILRGIALYARPIWDFPLELALLAAWIVLSSLVAVRVFKFN